MANGASITKLVTLKMRKRRGGRSMRIKKAMPVIRSASNGSVQRG
jgi:hypothetical protein